MGDGSHGGPVPQGAAAETPGVAIVVGASSGIGRATSIALAAAGWTVVLAARSRVSLEQAAIDCRQHAVVGRITVFPMDVTDQSSVDALMADTVSRHGRVDAVVHTAAVIGYGVFESIPAAEFDRAVITNLLGTAAVARAALHTFRAAGRGHLVLLGSLLGKLAVPFMGSYVVGKWGVQALARTLQIETRDAPNIHVSLVTPGSVDTPAYLQAANHVGREGRPPPPVDPPEKVARAVLQVLRRPRRDRPVGLLNGVMVSGFRLLPGVYDRFVTPLMKISGLSRISIAPHPGNLFEAHPQGDAVHGRWGRLGGRRRTVEKDS